MTVEPRPGWYPDPADHSMVRWWNGTGWTAHVHSSPPQGPADVTRQPAAAPEPRDVVQRRKTMIKDGIYADAEAVRCEGPVNATVRWADAEWFGYSITNRFGQPHLFLGVKAGKPHDYGTTMVFSVGSGRRFRFPNKRQILLTFAKGTHGQTDEHFDGLIRLCRRHLEPRLRDDIVSRLRAGERLSMGGIYEVDAHGIIMPDKRVFPWHSSQMREDNGIISLQPPGGAQRNRDIVSFTNDYPNVQLLPYLRSVFG